VISPTRWGYAAAATVDLRRIAVTAPPDALWRHETGLWALSATMPLALSAAFAAAALIALRPGSSGRPARGYVRPTADVG
jgi:hypothetical protein